MKNFACVAGTAKNVRFNSYNGRDFLSFMVRTADLSSKKSDGSYFTQNIHVTANGPLATRMKDKLKDGMSVCVEGRFEPYKDKKGVYSYPVAAQNIELMDADLMNCIVLQGRTTKECELRKTSSGTSVASNTVACSRNYKNKNNEWQETTSFIPVVAWEDIADKFVALGKGKLVWVVGRLTTRKWTDKDGNDHFVTEVTATDVYSGGTGKRNVSKGNEQDGSTPDSASSSGASVECDDFAMLNDGDEELPF